MPMQTMAIARTRGAFTGAFAAAPPPASPARPSPAKAQLFKKESKRDVDDEGESPMTVGESSITLERPLDRAVALTGRITRNKDGELIVEIEVSDELDWIVEDEAWLDDEDGGTTRATVDRTRTTQSQRVGGGHSIRLVLQLDQEPGAAPVRVRIGALEITV
jgi:hypothetical protein